MGGVVDEILPFDHDHAILQVVLDRFDPGLAPEPPVRHDLVELFELPQARNVRVSRRDLRVRQREATCPCKWRRYHQIMVNFIRRRTLAHEVNTNEGAEHPEEALQGPAGHSERSHSRSNALGSDDQRLQLQEFLL